MKSEYFMFCLVVECGSRELLVIGHILEGKACLKVSDKMAQIRGYEQTFQKVIMFLPPEWLAAMKITEWWYFRAFIWYTFVRLSAMTFNKIWVKKHVNRKKDGSCTELWICCLLSQVLNVVSPFIAEALVKQSKRYVRESESEGCGWVAGFVA